MVADPTPPFLSQVNFVGQGFNIYGALNLQSLIVPLFNFATVPTIVIPLLGKEYRVPTCTTVAENSQSYQEGRYCSSRESFQNSIATHVGVQGSTGAFSAEMEADFSASTAGSTLSAYLYRNVYEEIAYIELNEASQYISADFKAELNKLPDKISPDNIDSFYQFFQKFGIYYVQKIVIGGKLEFYVTLNQASHLSEQDASAMMSAEYQGLFVTGSIDASVKTSETWSAYTTNTSYVIRANGGDPALANALQSVDPANPSQNTVEAEQRWLESVASDPAVIDFSLRGIWDLCGDKGTAVREAWESFQDIMHPKLTVISSSQCIPWPAPAPITPEITLSSLVSPIQPHDNAQTAVGWQVVILNEKTLASPEAVLFTKYYTLENVEYWLDGQYEKMYSSIVEDLEPRLKKDQVLIMVSFGLDDNMPPTPKMQQLMRLHGAGIGLDHWLSGINPGSEPSPWVSFPIVYVLAGSYGSNPADAVELLNGWSHGAPVNLSANIFFYRKSYDGSYSLGLGS